MKVRNMTGRTGREVANQFIVTGDEIIDPGGYDERYATVEVFQSYSTAIAKKVIDNIQDCECGECHSESRTYLDRDRWDYSVTTSKYRNQFLGESKKETQAKIDSGEYVLTDLN